MTDTADRPVTNGKGLTRRSLMGWLIAGPTLITAASWELAPGVAEADGVPTVQPVDYYDLSDLLTESALPTMSFLTVTMNPDGTASFAIPRAEVGQGLTTAFAIIIADELGVGVDRVHCTLRDADPILTYNQLTGGSNSIHALYDPVRRAAATAAGQMRNAAASELGVLADDLKMKNGAFHAPDGRSMSFGELATKAAVSKTTRTDLKAPVRAASELRITGTDVKRVDGRAIVTGTKTFAMDIQHPDALPTMVCRPPTINASVKSVDNLDDVKNMPGVTDVIPLEHNQYVQGGVAVRAQTFGQCMDAVRALKVTWTGGSVDNKSTADVAKDLAAAELPMTPDLPGDVIDKTFTFHFRPGDPLETNCAVADVKDGSAEIWSCLKSPIWAREQIAMSLNIPLDKCIVHVAEGGGSFGRHLFCDAAFEAALVSHKLKKPVKLMWHRTDNFRHGRVHPMATSHVRATISGSNVVGFQQRHTSVSTDYTQGIGEIFTSMDQQLPEQNFAQFAEGVFTLTANVIYNFGPAVSQLIDEIYTYNTFNTSSVRNVYSPDVCTSVELMVDLIANKLKQDRATFRQNFLRDDRAKAVLDRVLKEAQWGRSLPAGFAQGIAVHKEYKGAMAIVAEIDTTPATVNRHIDPGADEHRHSFTGARVTKLTIVADVGLPINTLGLKAQFMGGAMDGIAQALTYGLHLEKGAYKEGSWDNAFYTRQWNTPPAINIIIMPPNGNAPGGAGEFAVGTTMAAVASAWMAATGTVPTEFPINFSRQDLGFDVYPTSPPIPESPTNGLNGLSHAASKRKVVKHKKTTKKKKTTKHSTAHKKA